MTIEEELSIWKTINATRSVDGLIEALKNLGPIEISAGRGAFDMAERVKRCYEDGELPNLLTRNYGIRQQYLYLCWNE